MIYFTTCGAAFWVPHGFEMAFSDEQRGRVLLRAGGRCECTWACPSHAGERCNALLISACEFIYLERADTPENCVVVCPACYRTYQLLEAFGYHHRRPKAASA